MEAQCGFRWHRTPGRISAPHPENQAYELEPQGETDRRSQILLDVRCPQTLVCEFSLGTAHRLESPRPGDDVQGLCPRRRIREPVLLLRHGRRNSLGRAENPEAPCIKEKDAYCTAHTDGSSVDLLRCPDGERILRVSAARLPEVLEQACGGTHIPRALVL